MPLLVSKTRWLPRAVSLTAYLWDWKSCFESETTAKILFPFGNSLGLKILAECLCYCLDTNITILFSLTICYKYKRGNNSKFLLCNCYGSYGWGANIILFYWATLNSSLCSLSSFCFFLKNSGKGHDLPSFHFQMDFLFYFAEVLGTFASVGG